MLATIKNMIQTKKSFMEDASLILENEVPEIDDSIVLGKDNDPDDVKAKEETDAEGATDDGMEDPVESTPEEEEPPVEGDETTPTEEPSEEPVAAEPAEAPASGDDDFLNMSIDGDDLPEPVGAQTGEPINDDDDLLNAVIDLGSNTLKDTLPVPPANAGEAIGGDEMEVPAQHVDSGFESCEADTFDEVNCHHGPTCQKCEESALSDFDDDDEPVTEAVATQALLTKWEKQLADVDSLPVADKVKAALKKSINETIESIKKNLKPTTESTQNLNEAISVGGSDEGGEAAPEDGSEPPKDNVVTKAVKDKVAESEEPTEEELPAEGEEDLPPLEEEEPAEDTSKDAIMKKMMSITKSIEDAKKLILDHIQ